MPNAHPIFWLLLAAVVAPLLGEIRLGFRVPVVVLEVILGIVIGPHVLGLIRFEGFVADMFNIGMALTLFMAGMELDFDQIKGRPLALAALGWIASVLVGFAAVGLLHIIPEVRAPQMVALALCTTGLGVLVPIFRDSGQLDTMFGRLVLAAGTLGEVGPIVAMSLLLSQQYSTWQEVGFLLAFLAIVGLAAAISHHTGMNRLRTFLATALAALFALGGRATAPINPPQASRRRRAGVEMRSPSILFVERL